MSGPAGGAILTLCTAIGKWAETRSNIGTVTDRHAVQHSSSNVDGQLGIPGAVPRRGTDSQTARLFQPESVELGSRTSRIGTAGGCRWGQE
jgi:hypothetical protein